MAMMIPMLPDFSLGFANSPANMYRTSVIPKSGDLDFPHTDRLMQEMCTRLLGRYLGITEFRVYMKQ